MSKINIKSFVSECGTEPFIQIYEYEDKQVLELVHCGELITVNLCNFSLVDLLEIDLFLDC